MKLLSCMRTFMKFTVTFVVQVTHSRSMLISKVSHSIKYKVQRKCMMDGLKSLVLATNKKMSAGKSAILDKHADRVFCQHL